MRNRYFRPIITVLLIIVLIPITFFMLILSAFTAQGGFYASFTLICSVLLVSWLIVWATRKVRDKYMWIVLAVVGGCAPIVFTGHEIYHSQLRKIPVLDDQGVSLYDYRPFGKNTKAARLDAPSALQLTDSLPVINGATALYPLYAAFVQATYPRYAEDGQEITYYSYDSNVRGGTTPEAYSQLISGEADLIFCAQPSREQLEEIRKTGKELHLTPIGREAFVFFINTKNPVKGLTSNQIRDIYSGKIESWEEIGGKDKPIRAFQRPPGSGSQTMLLHIMDGAQVKAAPEENRVAGMGGIIRETARYKNHDNAIGYSFLFFTMGMVKDKQIKLLEVDGVAPCTQTIVDGTYPFTGDFYAITLGEPKPNVKRLIDWTLSEQGQELVEKTGYVGINTLFP